MEHFLAPSPRRDTHLFGGLGLSQSQGEMCRGEEMRHMRNFVPGEVDSAAPRGYRRGFASGPHQTCLRWPLVGQLRRVMRSCAPGDTTPSWAKWATSASRSISPRSYRCLPQHAEPAAAAGQVAVDGDPVVAVVLYRHAVNRNAGRIHFGSHRSGCVPGVAYPADTWSIFP